MRKKDLALKISKDLANTGTDAPVTQKTANKVLSSMVRVIASSIKEGERVSIDNFCSFRPVDGKPRKANLKGQEVIPGRKRIRTVWSSNFMDEIL